MPGIFSPRVIFTLVLCLVLDVTFMPVFRFGFAQPVLLYLVVLYAIFKWDTDRVLMLTFFAGLLRDLTGAHAVGIETLSLMACTLMLNYFIHKIDGESWIVRLSVGFFYILTSNALILFISALIFKTVSFSGSALGVVFRTAVLSCAFLPLLFLIFGRWFGERGRMKQYELFR